MIYGYYLKNNTKTLKQQKELIMNYAEEIDENNIFFDSFRVKDKEEIGGLKQLIDKINPSSLDIVVIDNIKSLINFGNKSESIYKNESNLLKYEAIRKLYGYTKLRFVETPEFNSENFFEYIKYNDTYMCLPLNLDGEFTRMYFDTITKINKMKIDYYLDNKEKIYNEIKNSVTFNVDVHSEGVVSSNDKLNAFTKFRLEMLQEAIDRMSKAECSIVNNTFDFIVYFDYDSDFKLGFDDNNLFPVVCQNSEYFKEFKSLMFKDNTIEFVLKSMRNYVYLTSSIIKTLIHEYSRQFNEISVKKSHAYHKGVKKGSFTKKDTYSYEKKYVDVYKYIITNSKSFNGKLKDIDIIDAITNELKIKLSTRQYYYIKKSLSEKYGGMSEEEIVNDLDKIK